MACTEAILSSRGRFTVRRLDQHLPNTLSRTPADQYSYLSADTEFLRTITICCETSTNFLCTNHKCRGRNILALFAAIYFWVFRHLNKTASALGFPLSCCLSIFKVQYIRRVNHSTARADCLEQLLINASRSPPELCSPHRWPPAHP